MSDREERIGWWISGVAHAALILWALLGGVLFRPQPSQPVRMTEVATMSGAEFEEYAAASRGTGPVAPDATAVAEISEPEPEEAPAAPPTETAAPEAEEAAQELAQPDTAEEQPDLSDFENREPVNVATNLPDTPAAPDPVQETAPSAPAESAQPQADTQPSRPAPSDQDESAEPVAPRSVLALDRSTRPLDRPDGLVEAYNARIAEQEAAREAERLAAEAAEEAERQAAEQARQEAEAAAQAEREAEERRAAEAQAEEERRAEEAREAERRAAAEARAEQERRAAEQEAREEKERRAAEQAEREAEERRLAEEEARRAEEERRQAAEEAARREEERRAAEARAEEERRAAEEAEREEQERRAAAEREEAEREAADRQALEDALREAQQAESGSEGEDTASTGETTGGNVQRIEGGSGASVEQDPLSAALSEAMSQGGSAPATEEAPPDPNQLAPVPITPTPLPDPDQRSDASTETGGAAPLGQPLSLSEREGFRMALEGCWNRGALSVDASRVSVSVEFRMTRDGHPQPASLRLIDSRGGSSQTATQNAFETARRAILQCGRAGFPLPREKYGRWRDVIVDFRPEGIQFE